MKEFIEVRGARENNLQDIDVNIPRDKLVILTGVSGSGKSSLAFDTIYAEGQRRYVESLSSYARQFLGGVTKADVDSIEGLSPAISIDQKTTNNNPRSTVATVTEIADYLRLLYARIGVPYCPNHNHPITAQTIKQMLDQIEHYPEGTRLQILAPIVRNRKGAFKDVFAKLQKDGFVRVRVDKEILLLEDEIELNKNKKHNIEVIVDRIIIKDDSRSRLHDSIETALKLADGLVIVENIGVEEIMFSSNYSCPECGFSIGRIEPRLFSFNAPLGACEDCKGLGFKNEVDIDLLIPNKNLSINRGAIVYYKNIVGSQNIEWQRFEILCNYYNIDLNKPIKDFTKEELNIILHGSKDKIKHTIETSSGNIFTRDDYMEGVVELIERRHAETTSNMSREWYGSFMGEVECPTCHGARLNTQALSVLVNELNIDQLSKMTVKNLIKWFNDIDLTPIQLEIANLILIEIKDRLRFLDDVGLEYLTLNRMAGSLSGGEAQRIRLATQIGSHLTGVLYVLDEPSIGLHQRDNERLINTLIKMRDLGNTLVVVEHDEDTMLASDYIIDIGPGAGVHGGKIIAEGTPAQIMQDENSLTGKYLSGKMKIDIPTERKKGNGNFLEVIGASYNNLANIDVKIPLGTFCAITGVSGSGKSSLVNGIIYKALANNIYRSKHKPGNHKQILGLEFIDKVVHISQEPIGRTPRSNPATYTGVFDDIRDLFANTEEAKIRGYQKGRFSFNVKGGRCEACQGDGTIKISMHFLPDVYVVCEHCGGKRYNEETLAVTFKQKNIYDILDMTCEDGVEFFSNQASIRNKLQCLVDVGLGYIKLGQSSTTLSGGEAQRVKLASELQKRATGKTVYILDEPTTGLHSSDVAKLIDVLQRIVTNGDSIIVIEHNLDMIKVADYVIDLGPEGGDGGGKIVATGTPEEVVKIKQSYTGKFLKPVLEKAKKPKKDC